MHHFSQIIFVGKANPTFAAKLFGATFTALLLSASKCLFSSPNALSWLATRKLLLVPLNPCKTDALLHHESSQGPRLECKKRNKCQSSPMLPYGKVLPGDDHAETHRSNATRLHSLSTAMETCHKRPRLQLAISMQLLALNLQHLQTVFKLIVLLKYIWILGTSCGSPISWDNLGRARGQHQESSASADCGKPLGSCLTGMARNVNNKVYLLSTAGHHQAQGPLNTSSCCETDPKWNFTEAAACNKCIHPQPYHRDP